MKEMLVMNSISEFHRILGVVEPGHPLISVIHFKDLGEFANEISEKVMYNFYMFCFVKKFDGRIRYGQNFVDFDEGYISFFSPGQILSTDDNAMEGWILIMHPDFIRNHAFGTTIKSYGFFSYDIYEALFLSELEESILNGIITNIELEFKSDVDTYSQSIIISQVETLLNYANRFYNRQFNTRKQINHDLLAKLDRLLSEYFDNNLALEKGIPTVEGLAASLNMSAHYLSDMLRSLTGLNTQQTIQNKIVEKAKDILSGTSLSISEIAYNLGFSHPQSFNKFFKTKTTLSPLAFRRSFN